MIFYRKESHGEGKVSQGLDSEFRPRIHCCLRPFFTTTTSPSSSSSSSVEQAEVDLV